MNTSASRAPIGPVGAACAGAIARARLMAEIGWAMTFHSSLKLAGTVAGVVFAVLLSNFALGTFLSLLAKGTLLPRHGTADIWIVPKGAEVPGQGTVGLQALNAARSTAGVEAAAPLLVGVVPLVLPSGQRESVFMVGAASPYDLGGPWNVIEGDLSALRHPDTIFFESSFREAFGGLSVGSVREVAGRRTVVGGFTWGLVPFGAPYAYADFETAREYLHAPRDQVSFVLVRVAKDQSIAGVARALRRRVSDADVFTTAQFEAVTHRQIVSKTPIGITFGAITFFGILVGVVVVGLAMFSAVVDNLREFGMLKAIGCTNRDLTWLLLVQAAVFGGLGSLVGLALVAAIGWTMRSPTMGLELPWELAAGTAPTMVGMCACAAMLALARIRGVEPAMVFR